MDNFSDNLKKHPRRIGIGIGVLVIGVGLLIWFLVKSKDGASPPTRVPTPSSFPSPTPSSFPSPTPSSFPSPTPSSFPAPTPATTPATTPSPNGFVPNRYFPYTAPGVKNKFDISSPEECLQAFSPDIERGEVDILQYVSKSKICVGLNSLKNLKNGPDTTPALAPNWSSLDLRSLD